MKWPFPHRHRTQLESAEYKNQIVDYLLEQGKRYNLLTAPSVREGNEGLSIYSTFASEHALPSFPHDRLHIHTWDSSVHVCLYCQDAAYVLCTALMQE